MKQTKHTPGQWAYVNNGDEITIDCGDIYGAATMRADDTDDWPKAEQLANARLIAVAPELLEACRAMFSTLNAYYAGRPESSCCESWFKGRDAIAKAEGDEK